MSVSVVFRKSSAILVEFTDPKGHTARRSIPANQVELYDNGTKAKVSNEVLEQGISYGIPFEYRLRSVTVTPVELADSFHLNGIWTSEDIVNNQKAVISSLLSAFKISLSDILALADEFSKKEK